MVQVDNTSWYVVKINALNIELSDYFRLSHYNNYLGKKSLLFKRKLAHTIQIDLTQSEESIIKDFKSNTRNEVRRAIRDGFFFEKVNEVEEFVAFYNDFAKDKKLPPLTRNHLLKYKDNVVMYRSGLDNVTMTMHATILDKDVKRASLLYSASVRFDDNVDKKSVGFSNRFLHYKELIEFKNLGYDVYDFSGVCMNPDEKEKYAIGQFKRSFGGIEAETVHLNSYPMELALFIKKMIKGHE